MRHARPQKKHTFRSPQRVVKTVRKQPMAVPVKKERKLGFAQGAIKERLGSFFALIKRRLYITLSILAIILILFLLFGTSLFQIKHKEFVFSDTATDCISEEIITQAYFKKQSTILSHYFYTVGDLRKKYPCLHAISFRWNPFSFNTLSIYVEAEKPVAQVIITKIDSDNIVGSSDQYFNAQPLAEDIRYITPRGNFISLVTTPSVPRFRYRVLKSQKIDTLQINEKDLQSLLQLHEYLEAEFQVIAVLDLAQDGSVRFSTPFAEEIYVTLRDDLSVQLGSLQAILGTSTIDKKKIREIDLRFGNPVIHFR